MHQTIMYTQMNKHILQLALCSINLYTYILAKQKINQEKTKVVAMVIQRGARKYMDGAEVEEVQTAKYLGIMF